MPGVVTVTPVVGPDVGTGDEPGPGPSSSPSLDPSSPVASGYTGCAWQPADATSDQAIHVDLRHPGTATCMSKYCLSPANEVKQNLY